MILFNHQHHIDIDTWADFWGLVLFFVVLGYIALLFEVVGNRNYTERSRRMYIGGGLFTIILIIILLIILL